MPRVGTDKRDGNRKKTTLTRQINYLGAGSLNCSTSSKSSQIALNQEAPVLPCLEVPGLWWTGLPKASDCTERVGMMSMVSIAASSPKEKTKEWEGILFERLFYTYLYIYFSCRLYTTSKKECTKVCYLVHYPTNSIAFACFPKGKTNPIFIYLCVLVFTENSKCVHENCMITCTSVYVKKHVFKFGRRSCYKSHVWCVFWRTSLWACMLWSFLKR